MSQHTATISWSRGDQTFSDGRYSRGHSWRFDGGVVVPASSAPSAMVPLPLSVEEAVDPEEALVAALSSCHMLFFLAFAKKAGFVIDSYQDNAVGLLARDERGRVSITQVTLRPRVVWIGDRKPDAKTIDGLHHESHEACYIANSVRAEVKIDTQY